MIIGLTGGTGTGKTTVSAIFRENGFEVIDYDLITREVYTAGSPCLFEITKRFGSRVLNSDGTLNRGALGEIVFSNKSDLEDLNNIVYKYILDYTKDIIENAEDKKLLLDAPTLFEAGLDKKCNIIIGVISDSEKRIERICKRDNLSAKKARDRINSQKDNAFYIKNCDYIIDNSAGLKELENRAFTILKELNLCI